MLWVAATYYSTLEQEAFAEALIRAFDGDLIRWSFEQRPSGATEAVLGFRRGSEWSMDVYFAKLSAWRIYDDEGLALSDAAAHRGATTNIGRPAAPHTDQEYLIHVHTPDEDDTYTICKGALDAQEVLREHLAEHKLDTHEHPRIHRRAVGEEQGHWSFEDHTQSMMESPSLDRKYYLSGGAYIKSVRLTEARAQ